jgi:hypothetical protein
MPPLVLILMAVALALLGLRAIEPPPTRQLVSDAIVGALLKWSSAGQTFAPEEMGLYRVDVRTGNFLRRNTGPVIFHLRRTPADQDDLVTLKIDAAIVQESVFQRFEFAPLANAPGEPLYFFLEAPEAQSENAITLFGAVTDAYPDGEAIFVNLPYSGGIRDLTFRLHYRRDLEWTVSELLNRLAAHKPWPLGTPAWYPALGATLLLLLLGLVRLLSAASLMEPASALPDASADHEPDV